MYVVATAGHVDHGKSTLVRALTGMEPDRWAEERRRGMTIDLGFAWTALDAETTIAFVDVPGHERFVANMLAGVGPVPAAMIVVAADEGWMPQSAEHLAALDALSVEHGLLVVTRCDLADPARAVAEAQAEIAKTSLGAVDTVTVSGRTKAGLESLKDALKRLTQRIPAPDTDAPVRLWIDRSFTIKGAGTVVTGTLGGGTLTKNDELQLTGGKGGVRIRGLQSLGVAKDRVAAIARVAVNLRGVDREQITRGAALLAPGHFRETDLVDVRLHGGSATNLTLHIGSAAVPVRIRPLGTDTARLRLATPLPLRIGDRALLRDPGRHQVAGGITILDVDPPALRRRGAAAARAAVLETMDGTPDLAGELRRRKLIHRTGLHGMGVATREASPVAGDWFADPDHWAGLRERLVEEVAAYTAGHPLEPGVPIEVLRQRLGLPDRALVDALIQHPLTSQGGRVGAGPANIPDVLGQALNRALDPGNPFAAPEADHLRREGLGPRQLAAVIRAGLAIRLADQVILAPTAPEQAEQVLRGIPQPFTLSEARKALNTTRRVAVPLLELLDREGITRRLPDDRRVTRTE